MDKRKIYGYVNPLVFLDSLFLPKYFQFSTFCSGKMRKNIDCTIHRCGGQNIFTLNLIFKKICFETETAARGDKEWFCKWEKKKSFNLETLTRSFQSRDYKNCVEKIQTRLSLTVNFVLSKWIFFFFLTVTTECCEFKCWEDQAKGGGGREKIRDGGPSWEERRWELMAAFRKRICNSSGDCVVTRWW